MAATMSTGLVLVVALLAALLLLKAHHERAFDARLSLEAQALLVGLSRDKEGILIIGTLPEDPRYQDRLSGRYWIVRDASGILARSRSLGTSDIALSADATHATGPNNEKLRVVSLTHPQDTPIPGLKVIIAGAQSDVDRALVAEAAALTAGTAALAALLIVALWWQVNRSLRPLNRLVSDIAALQDGRIEKLPAAEYVELSKLTSVINDLLQHSRSLVANYRESTAKLAHALKTPLAVIAARADQGGEHPDAKVMTAVASMRRHIDRNLKRSRSAARSPSFARRVKIAPVVSELLFALGHAYSAKNLQQHQSVSSGLEFVGDREDLEEMLGNLIENAHKWAKTAVAVAATAHDGIVDITVEDDGPGLGYPLVPRPQPDREGDTQTGEAAQGLGLAITRQLAAGYRGSLTLANRKGGGTIAVLRLPNTAGS
ncbi:ATP-binding protein [Pseudorhodoplanes sp.]|uniref:ATP-binding protein n=1 Tax=Pseudorhodoplanes sp. TaxID=1934341 RepID=UPI00391DF972